MIWVFYDFFLARILSYIMNGKHINAMTGIIRYGAASSNWCSLSFSKQYVQGLLPISSASLNSMLSISYFDCRSPSHFKS